MTKARCVGQPPDGYVEHTPGFWVQPRVRLVGNQYVEVKQKYGATRCYVSRLDRTFDSLGEGRYALLLLWRQDAGDIRNLECQHAIEMRTPSTGRVFGRVYVDFRYEERDPNHDGLYRLVLADFKSRNVTDLQLFKLKARYVEAEYGTAIQVVTKEDLRGFV